MRRKWSEIAERLKAKPGEWETIDTFETAGTGTVGAHKGRESLNNRGAYLARRYGIEYATRLVGSEAQLYARWPKWREGL